MLDLSKAIGAGFEEADIYNLRSACEERLGITNAANAAAEDRYKATHQTVAPDYTVPQIVAQKFPLQGLEPKDIQISLDSPVR